MIIHLFNIVMIIFMFIIVGLKLWHYYDEYFTERFNQKMKKRYNVLPLKKSEVEVILVK